LAIVLFSKNQNPTAEISHQVHVTFLPNFLSIDGEKIIAKTIENVQIRFPKKVQLQVKGIGKKQFHTLCSLYTIKIRKLFKRYITSRHSIEELI